MRSPSAECILSDGVACPTLQLVNSSYVYIVILIYYVVPAPIIKLTSKISKLFEIRRGCSIQCLVAMITVRLTLVSRSRVRRERPCCWIRRV
jgi:hypothetical protein